jgi:hypothetical protein
MTERGLPIVDGAPACPFVAFEDDRDERAASPDHRHRCYAEVHPAPRALAHQEAYCLSSAFPVCPTFQDWARREAARSRADAARLDEPAAAAIATDQPRRNPPRNWAAPPPWMANGGQPPAWAQEDDASGEHLPREGRGLSGSYADRVASGGDAGAAGTAGAGVAAGAAAAGAGAAAAAGATEMHGDAPDLEDEGTPGDAGTVWSHAEPSEQTPPPSRREATSAPREDRVAAAATPRHEDGGDAPRERRRDPRAPEWERGRTMEVYPTLRARRLPELSVPPLLVGVIALALAAAVVFALPGLLGFGNPSAVATPTPTAQPSAAQSLSPTPVPEPTQQIYLVQSGDTMSKIAKKFGIPLTDLIAANKDTIPDPNKLQIGDQVIIPVETPNEIPAAT